MRSLQDAASLLEPAQEGGPATPRPGRPDPLGGRHGADAFGQVLEAEQLAPQGTCERLGPGILSA